MNTNERIAMENVVENYKDLITSEERKCFQNPHLLENIENAMYGLTEQEIREDGEDIIKHELHVFQYGDDEFA